MSQQQPPPPPLPTTTKGKASQRPLVGRSTPTQPPLPTPTIAKAPLMTTTTTTTTTAATATTPLTSPSSSTTSSSSTTPLSSRPDRVPPPTEEVAGILTSDGSDDSKAESNLKYDIAFLEAMIHHDMDWQSILLFLRARGFHNPDSEHPERDETPEALHKKLYKYYYAKTKFNIRNRPVVVPFNAPRPSRQMPAGSEAYQREVNRRSEVIANLSLRIFFNIFLIFFFLKKGTRSKTTTNTSAVGTRKGTLSSTRTTARERHDS